MMWLPKNKLGSDGKVPDVGQRQQLHYQQTVPINEELELPPSYEEAASSSRMFSRAPTGPSPAKTSAPFSANDVQVLSQSACSDTSDAEANDNNLLLGHRVGNRQQEIRHGERQWRQAGGQEQSGQSCDDDDNLHVRMSIDTAGYKATDPLYWEDKALRGTWNKYVDSPGCCASTEGGCCFSSRGACCFSDREGCCFSDRDGCCFSDRGGCFFSDLGGGFFSTGDACCCSRHSGPSGCDEHGVRL